jgi:hypothetical protein
MMPPKIFKVFHEPECPRRGLYTTPLDFGLFARTQYENVGHMSTKTKFAKFSVEKLSGTPYGTRSYLPGARP